MRTPERTIASTARSASYGRNAIASPARASGRATARTTAPACSGQARSSGLLTRAETAPKSVERPTTPKTSSVQRSVGCVPAIQPATSSRKSAGGTRLRLRLSAIFHMDSAESGFRFQLLTGPGTHGRTHAAICQSPRIHRCRRFASPMTV